MIISFVRFVFIFANSIASANFNGAKNITNLVTEFPNKNHTYPLAIIMAPNDSEFRFLKSLMIPAFEMALEKIQSWNINPIIKKLQYFTRADSNCENTRLSLYYTVMLLMYSKPSVWFGPVCDYSLAPIARLLPFWNIPVVTPGGGAFAFRKFKQLEYSTLTRIGTAIMTDHLNILFKAIFTKYKWKNVKLFYEFTFQNFCRHIALYFDDEKNVTERVFKSVSYLNLNTLYEVDIGSENSIVVLCVQESTVRKILLKAYDLNFINGEYVFFNIDLFERNTTMPWFSQTDTKENNRKAKEAYRALLTITVHRQDNEEYQNFLKEVHRRSKIMNIYHSLTPESNSFLGAFHDSLLLYALALNDTFAMNKSFEDGTTITKLMWNRNFKGITGDVSIDDNGDRNADYSLLDMDKETGKFKVVANYIGKEQSYQPVFNQHIDWTNKDNLPPPDSPACGYNMKNCPKRKNVKIASEIFKWKLELERKFHRCHILRAIRV